MHALMVCLVQKKLLTVDEMRRAIEGLPKHVYEAWGYYEKWAAGMTTLLLESGAITTQELNEALFGAKVSSKSLNPNPFFKSGDSVRVTSYRGSDQRGSGLEWRRPHI